MATKQTELNNLHELLAQVMAIQVGDKATWVNEEGEVVSSYTASPALLAVAAKFLKDNEITCSVEDDANLGELDNLLSKKQKKGRLALVDAAPEHEAAQ